MLSERAEAFHAKLRELKAGWEAAGEANPDAEFNIEEYRENSDALYLSFGKPIPVKVEKVDANGVEAYWVTPEGVTGDTVVFFTHGGAYVGGTPQTHMNITAHLAKKLNGRALSVHYRRAPEYPLPIPAEDCVKAYEWLLNTGQKPEKTVFAGESAGGALTITTQLLALRKGLPIPAASYTMSPWLDFEALGESHYAGTDLLGARETTFLFSGIALGPNKIDHNNPVISPLHASLKGIAPLFAQVGGDEALRSDCETLAKNAERDGVETIYEATPSMQHMFQMDVGYMPEADGAVDRAVAFLKKHLK